MADPLSQIEVTVVYARADEQCEVAVSLPRGASLRAAIERSRIVERYPEIDLSVNRVGVWNSLRKLDDFVAAGDRVEIYRPLQVDPKEARRLKAAADARRRDVQR